MAYLEAMLNCDQDAKKAHLSPAPFYLVSPNFLDATQGDANYCLKKGCDIIKQSTELDIMSRLRSDNFAQHRYMLSGFAMKIKLTACKDAFNLMTPDNIHDYRSNITFDALLVF